MFSAICIICFSCNNETKRQEQLKKAEQIQEWNESQREYIYKSYGLSPNQMKNEDDSIY